MSLPQVVIIGRPNVGKSSIFNWLAGRRIAIVDDVAGVTRDRNIHPVEHEGHQFDLIDTGGLGIDDVDDLTEHIEAQIEIGLRQADVVLFVVDSRSGLLPLDQEVAARLRHVNKPVICVANKTDDLSLDSQADEFFGLGFQPLLRVSVHQNRHKQEVLDLICQHLPQRKEETTDPVDPVMKLALVGRRNVGKSTFINTLTDTDRMIVSEVPGTTRDSVDVHFELDGKPFIAIDTPGLRKTKSVRTDIDFYGMHRAKRSIRRADVVLMFFDAGQRVSKVDKQLCNYIVDNHKPCIFVVNKWDLMVEHMPTQQWSDYLRETFATMPYVPIAFVTGQSGRNIKKMLNHAQMLFKQSLRRVTTGELNRLIRRALEHHPPPLLRHRRPKIKYATQVDVQPPTIVLMCNKPEGFTPSYRRYLLNILRDELSFAEVPIRVFFDRPERSDKTDGASAQPELQSDDEPSVDDELSADDD